MFYFIKTVKTFSNYAIVFNLKKTCGFWKVFNKYLFIILYILCKVDQIGD